MRNLLLVICFLFLGCSFSNLSKENELIIVNDVTFAKPQGFRVLQTGNHKVQKALRELKEIEQEDGVSTYVLVENNHTDSEPMFGILFMVTDLPSEFLQAMDCDYKSLMAQFLSSENMDDIHPFNKGELNDVVISNIGGGYRKVEYKVSASSKRDDLIQYLTFNEGEMVTIGLSKGEFSTRSDEIAILQKIKDSVIFKPVDICLSTGT